MEERYLSTATLTTSALELAHLKSSTAPSSTTQLILRMVYICMKRSQPSPISILWDGGEEVFDTILTLTLSDCIISGGYSGAGTATNILDVDPVFVDSAGGDFRLDGCSPAIDIGSNGAIPTDTADLDNDGDVSEQIPYDLDGDSRIQNGDVDLGAYEEGVSGCTGNVAGIVKTLTGVPISNTFILLHRDDDADGLPDGGPGDTIGFAVTTISGTFLFAFVTPGNYVLEEIQPTGYSNEYDEDETPDPADTLNVDMTDDLLPVAVYPNISDFDNVFVESLILSTISGTVFEDFDGDEEHDTLEGIDSVTMHLFEDADVNGLADTPDPIDSTLTDSLGNYLFADIIPGDYILQEVQPAGYNSIKDIDQSTGGASNDIDNVSNSDPQDDKIPVTVVSDEADEDNDFFEECDRVVMNIADNGPGSLRFIIECTDVGDTITFDAGLAGDTIILTSATIIAIHDLVIMSTVSPKIYVMSEVLGAIVVPDEVQVELINFNLISGILGSPAAIDVQGMVILEDVDIYRNPALQAGATLIINLGHVTLRGDCSLNDQ